VCVCVGACVGACWCVLPHASADVLFANRTERRLSKVYGPSSSILYGYTKLNHMDLIRVLSPTCWDHSTNTMFGPALYMAMTTKFAWATLGLGYSGYIGQIQDGCRPESAKSSRITDETTFRRFWIWEICSNVILPIISRGHVITSHSRYFLPLIWSIFRTKNIQLRVFAILVSCSIQVDYI